jgi:hypothetical protein
MCMGLVMLGRQKYRAEPLVPEPSSAFEVEMATAKQIWHKSLDTDQIPAELINSG